MLVDMCVCAYMFYPMCSNVVCMYRYVGDISNLEFFEHSVDFIYRLLL